MKTNKHLRQYIYKFVERLLIVTENLEKHKKVTRSNSFIQRPVDKVIQSELFIQALQTR